MDCNYDHIKLHLIFGEELSANNMLKTHSHELMCLSETIGGVFLELCQYVAEYDLYEGEVSEDNLYNVVLTSIELIDKSYIISCYPFFDNGSIVVGVLAKLDNGPDFVEYAREIFDLDEIIAHAIQQKNEMFNIDKICEYRPNFNENCSLLWSTDIDRWLSGEP